VVVVGGGIIGCGTARDAALRGFRVALVEQADFGSGTTAASTRIVHGGLRYLEQLDVRLVRLDLRERETLLRIAPHLVKPLEFLIPFFGRRRATALKFRTGLALYDALSFDKSLPSRRWLTAPEARAADPSLDRADIAGAAAYHDARVDSPERLALENVIDATRHGARVFNYCEAIAIGRSANGRDLTVQVRDRLGDEAARMTARVVVNATGAWVDPVAAALTGRRTGAIRATKGIHLVCTPMTGRALVLFSEVDRRLLFAIPRAGLTWIGTTDTDFSGDPRSARATSTDVDYLLRSVRHVFPSLGREDVRFTTAGVRALVRRGGTESSVSRMHKIVDGEPMAPAGVITVLGGKITGYRAIAEEVVDVMCRRLEARRPCTTSERPLPGAEPVGDGRAASASPLDDRLRGHLDELYGSRAGDVVAVAEATPALWTPLAPAYPDIAAQVIHGVRREYCVRLDDFMRRRSLLSSTADRGAQAVTSAAALMANELAWSTTRHAAEVTAALHPPGSDLDFSN